VGFRDQGMSSWQRSSRCDMNGSCVEVARHTDGGVRVRDGKLSELSPVLAWGPEQWMTFVSAVKSGQFDLG
jgi:hypothetical protein